MERGRTGAAAVDALPGLVGRRVTLRHRLAGGALTDSVGELADAGPGTIRVDTRRGPVHVLATDVVAVRAVPPAPARRPSWAAVARLEQICADGWPAPVDRPLGGWRLRAAAGFTGRANSTLAAQDPGVPVAEALARARAFAAEHRLPPRLQVPEGSPWHTAALDHGWLPDDAHPAGWRVEVLVGGLDAGAVPTDGGVPTDEAVPTGRAVTVGGRERWRVAATEPLTGAFGAAQEHVLTAPELAHVGFAVAPDGADLDRTAAGGAGGTVAGDTFGTVGAVRLAVLDHHLYVTRLWVSPEHRRQGRAGTLMAAAARWGAQRGARWTVLQVASHNAAALGLYRGLGFTTHHHYVYLRPPG